MPQELYRRQEQLTNLDKVEPYGTNAASRAASETSNVYARMSASWGRLMGQLSQKMAIREASRTAFSMDPETGVPLMPEKKYWGGINTVDAYQKSLDTRYEQSLRTALNEQLAEAERNNLFNEEQYRQEAAVIVGAMHEKVAPNFQPMFTEMATRATTETAAAIAYRRAMEERREARAAGRAAAREAQRIAAIEALPESLRDSLYKASRSGDLYEQETVEYGEEAANLNADVRYAKSLSEAAAALAYIDKRGLTPEVEEERKGGEAPEFENFEYKTTSTSMFVRAINDEIAQRDIELLQGVPYQQVDKPFGETDVLPEERGASEGPIPAAALRRPSMPGFGTTPEQAEAFAEDLTRDMAIQEFETRTGLSTIRGIETPASRAQAARHTDISLVDEAGMPIYENAAAYGEGLSLARLETPTLVMTLADMDQATATKIIETQVPGITTTQFWENEAAVAAARRNPVSGRFIEAVENGYLPKPVSAFLLSATSSLSTPSAAMRAARMWSTMGHSPTVEGSWAYKHPDEAGMLMLYQNVAVATKDMRPEEAAVYFEQVQTNFKNTSVQDIGKLMDLEKATYADVHAEFRKRLHQNSMGLASLNPLRNFGTSGRDVMDIAQFEKMIAPAIALSRGMNEPNVEQVLDSVMEQGKYMRFDNLRGSDGKLVQGGLKEHHLTAMTVTDDNPKELWNYIASKKLSTQLGIDVNHKSREISYQPMGNGEFMIWVNNDPSGLTIRRNEINATVEVLEREALRNLPVEGEQLFEMRTEYEIEIEQLMHQQRLEGNDFPEAAEDRLDELVRQSLKVKKQMEDLLPSTLGRLEEFSAEDWLGVFGGRGPL